MLEAGYAAPELATKAQKLAELILLECTLLSNELEAQYLVNRKSTLNFDTKNIYAEGENACDALKHKILKHFEIEE